VRELRVDRATDELAVDRFKIGGAITELAYLSWTNKCEVEWPKEKDNILASELLE